VLKLSPLAIGGPTRRLTDPTATAQTAIRRRGSCAVLDVAERELLSRHPPDDHLLEPGDHYDALDTVARLLLRRLDELRDLTHAYRRALDHEGIDDPF
jgi:hypothetical protein